MPETGKARVFGICGHPLAQSLSPVLHTWAMAANGIPGSFGTWDTPPGDLASFVRALRETPYDGSCVTIPHKETVMPLLDALTATAKAIGAVNTLFWENGRLTGHNTDMEGFIAPLRNLPPPGTALLLGAGGAARAVLAGLAALGAPRAVICARSRDRTDALIRDFSSSFTSLTCLPWEKRHAFSAGSSLWAVNTTPLGMRGKAEGESPMDAAWFAKARPASDNLAYDLVYNPLETAFLSQAKRAGWQTRDGLGMFIAQAAAQFRLWTGREMAVAEARAVLAPHLG